jgi:galacturonokinase
VWTSAPTPPAAVGRRSSDPILGNVSADEYDAHKHRLQDAEARRAAHFFSEGDRVRQGDAVWRQGDLAGFGALMSASGESLIRNYECGSAPLIDLYNTLIETEGVYGARFSGAGFRGCCVALVEPQSLEQVEHQVLATYSRRHSDLAENASLVPCDTEDGAAILDDMPGEPQSCKDDEHPVERAS